MIEVEKVLPENPDFSSSRELKQPNDANLALISIQTKNSLLKILLTVKWYFKTCQSHLYYVPKFKASTSGSKGN